jgi:uncharacterized protein
MRTLISTCLLLFCLSTNGYSQNTEDNNLLWQVTGNGLKKPSYLFGTFHLFKSQFVDSLTNVINSLNSSDIVAGEVDISDMSGISKMMNSIMIKDSTMWLDKVIPETMYKQLNDSIMKRAKMPLSAFNKFVPMYTMSLIMQAEFNSSSYYAKQKGELMDSYFQTLARKKKKKVIGLESLSAQTELLFTAIPLARQIELLKESLLQDSLNEMSRMISMYVNQRMSEFGSLMNGSMNEKEIELFLTQRNKQWIPQLVKLMKKQSVFVAVGAGHLPDKQGLISLLRSLGYTVEPLPLVK